MNTNLNETKNEAVIKDNRQDSKFKVFWKDKKNVIIVILAALLLFPGSATNSSYQNQIEGLNNQLTELKTELESYQKQVTNLENTNKSLQTEKTKLEEEKQELNNKIEELQNASSSETTSIPVTSSTTTTSSENNSEMVWVGNTGTKYHNEGCRTLKGNGHQITMEQALSEGRTACKVCH